MSQWYFKVSETPAQAQTEYENPFEKSCKCRFIKSRAKSFWENYTFAAEFQVLKSVTPKLAVGAVNAWNAIRALALKWAQRPHQIMPGTYSVHVCLCLFGRLKHRAFTAHSTKFTALCIPCGIILVKLELNYTCSVRWNPEESTINWCSSSNGQVVVIIAVGGCAKVRIFPQFAITQ